MHVGWMQLGDRFVDGPHFEIVNSDRAYAYSRLGGIGWLQECNWCPTISLVLPEGPEYTTVATDPAPWYDANNPDTEDFYGVVGLDVVGAEDSTRSANVTQAVTGGGVVGPIYFGPRTMVVRGIAVALNECGLQAGLDWLNSQYGLTTDACVGDSLTYFDCCPCLCETGDPNTVCWVDTYQELRLGILDNPTTGQPCTSDFWPETYGELRDGPGIASETWCSWIAVYRHLRVEGPPQWTCCTEMCVVPYMRQFHAVRIIGGPTVITHRSMPTCGAMAVFEFTLVAADPHEHTIVQRAALKTSFGDGEPVATATLPEPIVDPFVIPGRTSSIRAVLAEMEPSTEVIGDWVRESTETVDPSPVHLSQDTCHLIRLYAEGADALRIRVGIWDAEMNLVVGYTLPSLAANAVLTIDNQLRRVYVADEIGERPLNGFVGDWSGGIIRWVMTPTGPLTLTVDRDPTDLVEVIVEMLTASVGAA